MSKAGRQGSSAVLTILAIGVFMGGLDNGIMSSALTTLIHSFNVSASWGAWMITIYTLGLAVSVPIMAKLSDRYGRKRMFLISVVLFGLGSMSVALSHNFTLLLISRVLQSLGGGGIFPIANGYVVATVPVERQGRALGMIGGMNGIAAILGPNIGSLLLGLTNDWHWLFWINVPIALLLVIFGARSITENKAPTKGRLDTLGIILLSVGMLGLMYGLTNLNGANLLDSLFTPQVYGFTAGGVILLIIFLWYESVIDQRGDDPLIPMSLLRPELRWTLAIGLASGLLLSSVIFLPAFVQLFLGWPASQAGYWYTPMALFSGVGAMGGGAFMDKRGPITTLMFGFVTAAIGSALFPLWVTTTWRMVIASSLVGLGIGITLGAPLNFMITERVPDNKSTALGILSLVREVGLTLGPTIFSGFLTRSMSQFPQEIVKNLGAMGISPSQIPASELTRMQGGMQSFGDFTGQIHQIPSVPIQNAILKALHDVSSLGFGHLYWAAFVIAVVSIVFILLAGMYRRQSASNTGTLPAQS